MYSYFDQFVPGSLVSVILFWSLPFVVLILGTSKFYGEESRLSVFVDEFYLGVLGVFEGLGFNGVVKAGCLHLLVCLISVLGVMNYLGMVPFFYAVTSHPCCIFFFVIVFWGAGGFPMLANLKSFVSTFSVSGVGKGFEVLVVVSEVLSWCARPVILGVRLMANVFCGHLLMAVIAHLGCAMFWSGGVIAGLSSLVALSGFLVMESLVLGIQAYVFTLIVLYTWSEGFYSPWVKVIRKL